MLILPGSGFAARPQPLEHARRGSLALNIQIHGQEVDLPKYGKLPGYNGDFVFDPVEGYYYYNIYLRCLEAVRCLTSRTDLDANRIEVVGGSQGGI